MHRHAKEGPYGQLREDDELGAVQDSDDLDGPSQPIGILGSDKEVWLRPEDEDKEYRSTLVEVATC